MKCHNGIRILCHHIFLLATMTAVWHDMYKELVVLCQHMSRQNLKRHRSTDQHEKRLSHVHRSACRDGSQMTTDLHEELEVMSTDQHEDGFIDCQYCFSKFFTLIHQVLGEILLCIC